MTFLIESLVACAFFTLFVFLMSRNPIKSIFNYPPAIIERCDKLGLVNAGNKPGGAAFYAKKVFAIVLFGVLMGRLVSSVNGCTTFWSGALTAYALWTVVNWYDALVMDCLWFCHDKHFVIPGTEDMVKEYHDYWFHIKGSLLGMLLGIPAALMAGLMTILLSSSGTFIPKAPDYADATMWITADGDPDGTGADVFYVVSTWEKDWTDARGRVSHYADVWNPEHREHMAQEINGVAAYMTPGNRFRAPFYRHTTIEAFDTQDENVIRERTRLAMSDVCAAFDQFLQERDGSRPIILAGFSQGGKAVVELLKHMDDATYDQLAAAYVMGYKVTAEDMAECPHIRAAEGESDTGVTICYNTVKDEQYVIPVLADSFIGINPVNWVTDATPAILHDTITVTLAPTYHALVVTGYEGSEYKPHGGYLNVGNIHSCEPWLYSDCIQQNIAVRTAAWRHEHSQQ